MQLALGSTGQAKQHLRGGTGAETPSTTPGGGGGVIRYDAQGNRIQ